MRFLIYFFVVFATISLTSAQDMLKKTVAHPADDCDAALKETDCKYPMPVAHSIKDWLAASSDIVPKQGFRGWQFGYYENGDTPKVFQELSTHSKSYWGDGNFTKGAIMKDSMAWFDHKRSPAGGYVVRRWTIPKTAAYQVTLSGAHSLECIRKLHVFHNQTHLKTYSFPKDGKKYTFSIQAQTGDFIDFSADKFGESLKLTIAIDELLPGLSIVAKGRCNYQIVIPDDSSSTIPNKAAKLLQRILKESTGCELPILQEAKKLFERPAFYIGNCHFSCKHSCSPADMQFSQYRKKIIGKDVILQGVNQPACTTRPDYYQERPGDYKAVCSFLESELGARFLLPSADGEFIPQLSEWTINPTLDILHTPSIPNHQIDHFIQLRHWEFEPFLSAGNFFKDQYNFYAFGHSWPSTVPPSKYAKTHPEYFVMQGGVRQPQMAGTQLCYSNPDVRRLFLEKILHIFSLGLKDYQLCQSDGFVACECAACKALGEPREAVWKLHRQLAEKAFKQYPDCKISILSYALTQIPPQSFDTFPPNVNIELSKYDEKEFRKWMKYKNVQCFKVYSYNWGVYHELGYLPKRTPKVVAEQLRRFVKYNVHDIFDCGFINSWGLQGPTVYTYMRMLDDVSLNPDSLCEDYCQHSFGKAGFAMFSFFSIMHKYLESYPENPYFTCDNFKLVRTPESMITTHFPPSAVNKMANYLSKAEKLVETAREKKRLKLVRLDFDYLQSMVRTLTAYRAYQLFPDSHTFKLVCTSLREREKVISAIVQDKELPWQWRNWNWYKPNLKTPEKSYRVGGSLSGKLGAPFTWDYETMEKECRMPTNKVLETSAARLTIPIVFDGRIDDEAWKPLAKNKLGKVSGGMADVPSFFKVSYDDKNLYLAFYASYSKIGQKTFVSTGKDHYIPSDNFDIMMNPTNMIDRYYQFIFSPADNSYLDGVMNIDKIGAAPDGDKLNVSWNGGWQYKYHIDKVNDCWTAELVIPFDSMNGYVPRKGAEIIFQVGHIYQNKLYLWSPNGENQRFNNTAAFGNLHFD